MKNLLLILFFFSSLHIFGQNKKVLFIGNSYTGNNNLAKLVYDVALSTGDTLIYDKYTPGGARLMTHATNPTTLSKISSDDWDHVVLQAQSQEPSFPIGQVESEVFPYAEILCDSIRANNECTRPVFYMTWGRENGDANNCAVWPPVCTYEGMDSLLNLRYRMMGDNNEAYVSPVGAVWRYIRENHPDIDLYANDGSHPSQAGSYAGACTFYAILFQKDPTMITFDYTLSEADAMTIRAAAKAIAFDDLGEWNVGDYDPVADFGFTQDGLDVVFENTSENVDDVYWDFGDGTTSTDLNPSHTFENNNTYTVQLIVTQCGISDTTSVEIVVEVVSTKELSTPAITVFPNPTDEMITIKNLPINTITIIFDQSGKELQRIVNSKDNLEVNLSKLSQGVYFVKSQTKSGELLFAEKIVKN